MRTNNSNSARIDFGNDSSSGSGGSNVQQESSIDMDNMDWLDHDLQQTRTRKQGSSTIVSPSSDQVYHTIEKCRMDSIHLLQHDDRVKEIVSGIKNRPYGGTNILDEGLIVEMCAPTAAGGGIEKSTTYSGLYEAVRRIRICCNRNAGIYELRRTLIHELVHAYDYSRGFNRRLGCKFRACTEVRAYMLGGSCDMPVDLAKFGGENEAAQREACIKHHAYLSVLPYCDDATKLINEVYPQCHRDYSPIHKEMH